MPNLSWWNAYQIERDAAAIFHKQVQDGWWFDKDKCYKNIELLESEMVRLYDIVRPSLTYEVKQLYNGPLNKPFLKDGSYGKSCRDYCISSGMDVSDIGGPFSRISFEEPNLGSPEQIKNQLLNLGWKPKNWNYKKEEGRIVYENGEPIKVSPKLDKDSYEDLPEELGNIRTWLIYSKRLEQHRTFLEGLRGDGTIPSNLDSLGAITGRVTHRKPITNIPRPGSTFGKETRELFIARPGRVLVGTDAAQIEARIIAHVSILILGHTKLADNILDRDFHQVIFEALEGLCTNRQAAKTPEYCFLYGGQEEKLGKSIDNRPEGWSYKKAGTEVMRLMQKNIPGIIEVRDALTKAAERGFLIGLDGRKLFVRKAFAALNTYAQGNSAILAKEFMIKLNFEGYKRKLDFMQTGFYHDEVQLDVLPEHADELADFSVQCIKDTGVKYGLNVPLDGEAKKGKDWSITH